MKEIFSGTELIKTTNSAPNAAVVEISFDLPALQAGDCRMHAGARITLRSDGTTAWSAVTRSSDTNDRWEIRFHFLASNGFRLFTMPEQQLDEDWYYQDMPERDTDYRWNANHWIFDPTKFQAIHRFRYDYRC